MGIEYSFYTLTPKKLLNGIERHGDVRKGMLLRLDEEFFSDYHPWSQFGDLSCEEVIKKIKSHNTNQLKCLTLFALDKERKLILDKAFLNHKLLTLSDEPGKEELTAKASKQGVWKLKGDQDTISLASKIKGLKGRVRIDFNNTLSFDQTLSFWQDLPLEDQEKIEYIEDPFYFDKDLWENLGNRGVPLASDRNPIFLKGEAFIYKPNMDFMDESFEGACIFSSYMGHDLGRYHTYLELMKHGDLSLVHGIHTPDIYEEQISLFEVDDFSVKLRPKNVERMYEELREREWIKLI